MMQMRRRLMMAPKSKLPSGYIPLEYIESTGTQCINTGVKPTSETVCRIKVNMTRINTYTTVGYSTGKERDSFRFFNANSLIYLDYGSGSVGNRIYGGSWPAGQTVNFEFGNRYVKDLDTDKILISDTAVGTFSKSYTIYLMDNRTTSGKGSGKVYYLQIINAGILVRDYLPCINPSGAIGMYDLVGKQFYGNSGTGTFVAGPAA